MDRRNFLKKIGYSLAALPLLTTKSNAQKQFLKEEQKYEIVREYKAPWKGDYKYAIWDERNLTPEIRKCIKKNSYEPTDWCYISGKGFVEKVYMPITRAPMPFLPTLEYLQGHDKDVLVFTATYSSRGTWDAWAFRKYPSKSIEGHRAFLFFENGQWFAIDKEWRDDDGKLHYHNKIKWPSWLRKF